MGDGRRVYARHPGRPGVYLSVPPRCPVHDGYMPFRHALDMYACGAPHPGGRYYYVTWATWRRHLAGDDLDDPGFFGRPVPAAMPRLGI